MPPSDDPRFPPVSSAAGELAPSRRRPRAVLPLPLAAGSGEVHLLCPRPVDHFVHFGELFRIAEALRERTSGAPVDVWLRSELEDGAPFALLPVDGVGRLPATAAGRERLLARLERPGAACVLVGPGRSWEEWLRSRGIRLLGRLPLGWRVPAAESPQARAAGQAYLRAQQRETPRWVASPGAARPPDPERAASFLVQQARFHVGDTLWLTPLLRALRRRFPRARTTVVAPPAALDLLRDNPHVAEVLPYAPCRDAAGEGEARGRVLDALAGRRFDAALFAFARRPEARWLARAAAAAGAPWRINLEYFDPALDSRRIPRWLTHEGWFFWGSQPSPRMLLHALDPLLGPGAWTEEDRRVELPLPAPARRRAADALAERGLGTGPFAVIAPGGLSSLRWPAERFAGLAARLAGELGLHVLVEGSPAEAPRLAEIAARAAAAAAGSGRRIVAAADPLAVFAALLARARLLVANDSAPIHLAEAAGTPTLYFAQREKLVHSHPAGPVCWALYDEVANDPRRITVEQALKAARPIADHAIDFEQDLC